MMVTRIWRATATAEGAKKYRLHFERNVMPELNDLKGFRQAYLLTRERGGAVDIEVHTLWDSLDAIHAFASPDVDAAVVEPQAQAVLTGYDRTVTHFSTLAYLPPAGVPQPSV